MRARLRGVTEFLHLLEQNVHSPGQATGRHEWKWSLAKSSPGPSCVIVIVEWGNRELQAVREPASAGRSLSASRPDARKVQQHLMLGGGR